MLYFIDRYTQTNRTAKYQSIKQSPTAQNTLRENVKRCSIIFLQKRELFYILSEYANCKAAGCVSLCENKTKKRADDVLFFCAIASIAYNVPLACCSCFFYNYSKPKLYAVLFVRRKKQNINSPLPLPFFKRNGYFFFN